jgi:hypothetical protein
MRRNRFLMRLGVLPAAAILFAGFVPGPNPAIDTSIIRIQTTEPAPSPQAAPATTLTPTEASVTPAVEPERPLTSEEQKAADIRLHFDRVLVDAAVLLTDFENTKRGKSKAPVSMSAFRNLEIQLNAIADADPSNEQAREMAKEMQMAQYEILQPSVAVADVASRQLYADAMTAKLQDQDIKVAVGGSGARVVRFMSRQMTREMGEQLGDSAKIFDTARRLQFDRVIFTNGRRSWTYSVARGRYR